MAVRGMARATRAGRARGLHAGRGADARPGNKDIQLDLFLDYANNLSCIPAFQQFFRERKPPLLAIWGKNDPFFIPAGAEAFRRDNPNASVIMLDTGHFALETHVTEIAIKMRELLTRIDG